MQALQGIRSTTLMLVVLVVMVGCDTQKPSQSAVTNIGSVDDRHGALRVQLVESDDGETASFDLIGLPASELQAFAALDEAQRGATLQVFVGKAPTDDLPAIAGTATVVGNALRFSPRYPFRSGLHYCVRIDRAALGNAGDAGATPGIVSFSLARPEGPATQIAHVYPTADRLPENHLKFYVHFSAPMSRGEAYERVHLLDADGHELPAVFLELGEELWDPAMQRFTLLFDPGRVKRGLVPREELGSVLTAGRDYTLVIDADWHDAQGQPLAAGLRKPFHVEEVDQTPIDISTWKLVPPPAASRDPLAVTFPEPLDHSLLQRLLHVTTAAGEAVAGTVEISLAETRWQFTPEQPWPAGDYELVVETTLEDLAGNAVGRAFDVDLFGPVTERIETETVSRPITIAAP
ncbi:MAG TPA: Ig-like domain-containing protein [Pirellulales bacterium]|nr:Ig-like domain-containing protein [Pirellulales bacterium]